MLEDDKLKEAEKRVKQYMKEGVITTRGKKEFVGFFLRNARDSLESAKVLYDLSVDREKQGIIGIVDFNGLLWVVNAGYYSMFYMARALLESEGIKITSDLSIHARTFDALVYFFYLNGRLQKRIVEYLAEAEEEASNLLGMQKANDLIKEYFFEKDKRTSFTYDTSAVIIRTKAKTSVDRAIKFNEEIRKILKE